MSTDQFSEYLDAATEAARRGAAELERWRKRFVVRRWPGRLDRFAEAVLLADEQVVGEPAEEVVLDRLLGGVVGVGDEVGPGLLPDGEPGPPRPQLGGPPVGGLDGGGQVLGHSG